MSNDKAPQKTTVDSKTSATTDDTSSSKAEKDRALGRKRGSLLLIIVIVVSLGGGGYYYWQHYNAPTNGENSFIDNVLGTFFNDGNGGASPQTLPLADIKAAIANEAEARNQQSQSLNHQLAGMQLKINNITERLHQLSTTSRDDWLLAEAEYLLRLANQRLLTERQSKNAVSLLEAADAILRDLDDVDLFPVRKALAEDITRLRLAGVVDREGVYLQLGALITAVDNLAAPLPKFNRVETLHEMEPVVVSLSWGQQLWSNAKKALLNMTRLVRIERRDTPLKPMLSVTEEQLLRYNLRIMLEQAQLALLREEPGIYQASLIKAGAWVKAHFINDAVAAAFLESLNEAQAASIEQALPSMSTSLKALQNYIHVWHNRYSQPQVGSNGEAHQ